MTMKKIPIDLSKEINEVIRVRKDEREKRKLEEFGHFDVKMIYAGAKVGMGTKEIYYQMNSLKELKNIKKELKDINILIFEIPKAQANFKLSNGKTILEEIKDKVKWDTTYLWEESGAVRKRKGEEKYPFRIEIKAV